MPVRCWEGRQVESLELRENVRRRDKYVGSSELRWHLKSAQVQCSILTPIPVYGFFPIPSNSLTLAGCPTIQLNSDTIYLEIAQIL